MNEKLFRFFAKEIGCAEIDGREYAFCHPLKLEVDGIGELFAMCTAVDREENFYELWWSQSVGSCSDDWGRPVVKLIGKIKDLPVKDMEEVIFYLERRVLLSRIK